MSKQVSKWMQTVLEGLPYAIAFVLLATIDRYSLDYVSPETPFMKIGEMAFQRMELIAVLFGITMLAGLGVGKLFRIQAKTANMLAVGVGGCIVFLIGVFDVDFLQKLIPTLRISHVIMTISQIIGIASGAIGLVVGLRMSATSQGGKSTWMMLGAAGVLSILAFATNAYRTVYLLVGILALIAVAVAALLPNSEEEQTTEIAAEHIAPVHISQRMQSAALWGGLAATAVCAHCYYSYTVSQAECLLVAIALASVFVLRAAKRCQVAMPVRYASIAVSVAVWIVACTTSDPFWVSAAILATVSCAGFFCHNARAEKSDFLAVAGVIVMVCLAWVLNHMLGEVVQYSGNRVVYQVHPAAMWIVWLPYGIATIAQRVVALRGAKKQPTIVE